jgi:Predicted solute binding protein
MKTRNSVRYLISTVGAGILLVAFNNCGEGFIMQEMSSTDAMFLSGKACDEQLMKVYQSTYHGFLNKTCQNCHISGPGIGTFASENVKVSYNSFMSIGSEKISSHAVSDTHKPPYTGSQNTAAINSYKTTWAAAQEGYASCVAQNGGGGDDGGTDNLPKNVVRSIAKQVPANLSTTFQKLEFDLDAQTTNKVPLVAGIELRVAVLNGVTQGYEFRNPTLRLKAANSGAHNARALNIVINNILQTDITTYVNIDSNVDSTTAVNLAPNAGLAWSVRTPASTDTMALEFQNISATTVTTPTTPTDPTTPTTPTDPTTPTPTAQTYTQLIASNGVLGRYCVSCHGNNGSGGLNLLVYNNAKNAAANIKARMNNANNPMPTSGLVPQAQRDIIDAWVAAGAPQ